MQYTIYFYHIQIICSQFYHFNYSNLILIRTQSFFNIKYSYLTLITHRQIYLLKYYNLILVVCTQLHDFLVFISYTNNLCLYICFKNFYIIFSIKYIVLWFKVQLSNANNLLKVLWFKRNIFYVDVNKICANAIFNKSRCGLIDITL